MASGVLLAAASACGFISAGLAGKAVCEDVEHASAAASMQPYRLPAGRESPVLLPLGERRRLNVVRVAAFYVRNGVAFLQPAARVVCSVERFRGVFSSAAILAQRRGWASTPISIATLAIGCALVLVGAVAIATRSWFAALMAATLVFLGFAIAVSHAQDKEREALRDQIPDALRCMEACLHAGLSLPQAFAEISASAPFPSNEVFAQVSRDLEFGYTMDDALNRFYRMAEIEELGFVAMALDVQYTTGGSAAPILRSAEDSVLRGLELRRSLRVQTAQARLSAQVVSLMPFVLLFVLSSISPGFLAPFMESSQGVAVFAAAILMNVSGVIIVRRMLDVKL